MKDLNKSQLILLAILLSFVTSMATGITTVTLMQQAPQSVVAPINRIVQQTVEKIQQVEGKTTTQTVIIKEEDLVVDAIAKNKTALFTVTKEVQDANAVTTEVFAGKGFAISTDGIVVVDATLVSDKGVYYLKNDSGKFKADFVSTNKAGFAFLKIGASVNSTDKIIFTVPAFGDLSKMKTGQKILLLGGNITSTIFEGLNGDKGIDLTVIKSNIGGLVLDLDGNVLGIALANDNVNTFASIKSINDALTTPSSASTLKTS